DLDGLARDRSRGRARGRALAGPARRVRAPLRDRSTAQPLRCAQEPAAAGLSAQVSAARAATSLADPRARGAADRVPGRAPVRVGGRSSPRVAVTADLFRPRGPDLAVELERDVELELIDRGRD